MGGPTGDTEGELLPGCSRAHPDSFQSGHPAERHPRAPTGQRIPAPMPWKLHSAQSIADCNLSQLQICNCLVARPLGLSKALLCLVLGWWELAAL